MTERTLPIDYKVHASITSGRALPAEIAEIMAQLDKTTPGWRNAIRDALGILLSMLAAQRLIKPLSELAIAVEHLGGSGDTPPILARGPRELRGTIQAFNRMQARLHRFNEDRTRMIAAMSHDLRTPLTRLRLRAELVEDADKQRKMLADLDGMRDVIEAILAFARDDTKHEPRSLLDLSALVEGICQDASDAGEPVTFSGPRGVTISGRPTALRRAVHGMAPWHSVQSAGLLGAAVPASA